MEEPKCPKCSESGVPNIRVRPLVVPQGDQVKIIYCDYCGYIYGVFPKP